jgi:hypothetical protein
MVVSLITNLHWTQQRINNFNPRHSAVHKLAPCLCLPLPVVYSVRQAAAAACSDTRGQPSSTGQHTSTARQCMHTVPWGTIVANSNWATELWTLPAHADAAAMQLSLTQLTSQAAPGALVTSRTEHRQCGTWSSHETTHWQSTTPVSTQLAS